MLDFNIPEKLFILSIDDEKGRVTASVRQVLHYGLAGGLLAELALANKVRLEEDRLILADSIPAGDRLIDEILAMIATEKRPRKLTHWIDILGRKQTVRRVAERLAKRNVIAIEEKRYLWIIPYEVYPQKDASAKYWVKQELRGIVLAGERAENEDIALLSLLKTCRLLRQVFTRDERKSATQKVDELVKGEVFGENVAKVLADIEATMIAAVTVATG
jgi:hypothetical protein